MKTNIKLDWATNFANAKTFYELEQCQGDSSYCYAAGGIFRFKSTTIDNLGTIKTNILEQRVPDLNVSKIQNSVLFSAYGILTQGGDIFAPSLPGWFNHRLESEYQNFYLKTYYSVIKIGNEFHVELPKLDPIYYSTPAVMLGTPTDDAFSHFIFETLAKLSALPRAVLRSHHFIVSSHIKQYQIELLVKAGIDKERIILRASLGDAPIQFKEILLIKWPSHNNLWTSPCALLYLRDFFTRHYGHVKSRFSDMNYLDRNDERQAYRNIVNEKDVKLEFTRSGFDIHTPGTLNFSDKFNLFRSSAFLAGQYGGGLQLCFLASFGTKVIVIQSKQFVRTHIDFMASILGFEVINTFADPDPDNAHANASITADITGLVTAIMKIGTKSH